MFQEGRLFPHLSVRQNLDYGRRMSGRRRVTAKQLRAASLTLLDIGHLLGPPDAYCCRAASASVSRSAALFLMRPRLLLLDEPLASLDDARKHDILPYLIRLRDEAHVPMVYVSHSAEELRQIATNVVRLDAGQCDRGRPELLG